MFNHNHTFVFEISDSDDALYCNQTIKTEVPGDVTLPQICYAFQCYLKGAGYVFDGYIGVCEGDPPEAYGDYNSDHSFDSKNDINIDEINESAESFLQSLNDSVEKEKIIIKTIKKD